MTARPFQVCHVVFEKLLILLKNYFTHIIITTGQKKQWSIRAIKRKFYMQLHETPKNGQNYRSAVPVLNHLMITNIYYSHINVSFPACLSCFCCHDTKLSLCSEGLYGEKYWPKPILSIPNNKSTTVNKVEYAWCLHTEDQFLLRR